MEHRSYTIQGFRQPETSRSSCGARIFGLRHEVLKGTALLSLVLSLGSSLVSCQSAQIRQKQVRMMSSAQSLNAVILIAEDPKTVRPKPKWGPQEKILQATLKAQEPTQALEEIKAVQKSYQVKSVQALLAENSSVTTVRTPSAVAKKEKTISPKRQFLDGFASHLLTIQDLSERQDQVFAALDQALQRSRDLQFSTYLVRPGQTLQTISWDLYSTTRRWPEIFLLNRNQLQSWNSVRPGQELKVVAPNP